MTSSRDELLWSAAERRIAPECTPWACWRLVWLHWSLWRSCAGLVHRWPLSRSSTSRNHWWTPADTQSTRVSDVCYESVILTCWRRDRSPGLWAGNPRWRWWCWPSCCSPSVFSDSSGSLMQDTQFLSLSRATSCIKDRTEGHQVTGHLLSNVTIVTSRCVTSSIHDQTKSSSIFTQKYMRL